jgi:cyanophycin synthetase
VLDTLGVEVDDQLIAAWRERTARAAAMLGWVSAMSVARRHAGGVSLALSAPIDQLFLATEVNEWSYCAALRAQDPVRWNHLESALVAEATQANATHPNPQSLTAPVLDEAAAMARFVQLQSLESRPDLQALLGAAALRHVPYALDDAALTLGAGVGGRSFPLSELPRATEVSWTGIHSIPTAIVTGSNGKTTTVRLIAACARRHGWPAGYNCTDGVFLDGEALVLGDYSGPDGARRVIREPRVQAAVLETARGGILRRGIAVSQVDVGLVTNVSADHFGEYGIYDLSGLAAVKLAIAGVVKPKGLLVLNAEDPELRASTQSLAARFGKKLTIGWFSGIANSETLQHFRANGASSCGVGDGHLLLQVAGQEHDLGAIRDLPLSWGGVAAYNVANMAGAALAAAALGIPPPTIAAVLAVFGTQLTDNPGRMMRFEKAGVQILIDYAHNPDGLRGFLQVAQHLRGGRGRLGLLLGHAGNRTDADIRELAQAAFAFHPDLVVLKENESQLRGRAPGEVSALLRAELTRLGVPDAVMPMAASELEAARLALDWAVPGDVLALPLHSLNARNTMIDLLAQKGP